MGVLQRVERQIALRPHREVPAVQGGAGVGVLVEAERDDPRPGDEEEHREAGGPREAGPHGPARDGGDGGDPEEDRADPPVPAGGCGGHRHNSWDCGRGKRRRRQGEAAATSYVRRHGGNDGDPGRSFYPVNTVAASVADNGPVRYCILGTTLAHSATTVRPSPSAGRGCAPCSPSSPCTRVGPSRPGSWWARCGTATRPPTRPVRSRRWSGGCGGRWDGVPSSRWRAATGWPPSRTPWTCTGSSGWRGRGAGPWSRATRSKPSPSSTRPWRSGTGRRSTTCPTCGSAPASRLESRRLGARRARLEALRVLGRGGRGPVGAGRALRRPPARRTAPGPAHQGPAGRRTDGRGAGGVRGGPHRALRPPRHRPRARTARPVRRAPPPGTGRARSPGAARRLEAPARPRQPPRPAHQLRRPGRRHRGPARGPHPRPARHPPRPRRRGQDPAVAGDRRGRRRRLARRRLAGGAGPRRRPGRRARGRPQRPRRPGDRAAGGRRRGAAGRRPHRRRPPRTPHRALRPAPDAAPPGQLRARRRRRPPSPTTCSPTARSSPSWRPAANPSAYRRVRPPRRPAARPDGAAPARRARGGGPARVPYRHRRGDRGRLRRDLPPAGRAAARHRNWPPPGCGCSPRARSPTGWTTASASSPTAAGPCCPASRRCARSSTGPGSCWTKENGPSCAAWPPSPAAVPSPPPRRSAPCPARAGPPPWTPWTSRGCSAPWSTSRCRRRARR
ncbi:hypothetical protein SCYAM73S_00944 [Streptomyces cyaneofuscatus]